MLSPYLLDLRNRRLGIKTDSKATIPDLKKYIKPVAPSRKELNKEYRKVKDKMMKGSNLCEINAPGCDHIAQGLHHIVKRSPNNLCDPKNLLRSCNLCNEFLENNDAWGRERGFIKSKFEVVK